MYIKSFIISLFIFFISLNLFSVEKFVDVELIKKASSPKILTKGILITIPSNIGKHTFLRTNLDNWKNNYYFEKSLYNVYYLVLPYDLKKTEILYKLNIAGNWERDPNNPDFTEDKYGTELSRVQIPSEIVYYQKMPIIEESGESVKKVSFKYFNPNANEVNFVSSVDKWTQFSHSLEKNENGYWEISFDFKKGIYGYYFLVDGKKVLDIENENKMWDESVGQVSFFRIE
jgi:hypothetical protein